MEKRRRSKREKVWLEEEKIMWKKGGSRGKGRIEKGQRTKGWGRETGGNRKDKTEGEDEVVKERKDDDKKQREEGTWGENSWTNKLNLMKQKSLILLWNQWFEFNVCLTGRTFVTRGRRYRRTCCWDHVGRPRDASTCPVITLGSDA